jgi:hypothetical protein
MYKFDVAVVLSFCISFQTIAHVICIFFSFFFFFFVALTLVLSGNSTRKARSVAKVLWGLSVNVSSTCLKVVFYGIFLPFTNILKLIWCFLFYLIYRSNLLLGGTLGLDNLGICYKHYQTGIVFSWLVFSYPLWWCCVVCLTAKMPEPIWNGNCCSISINKTQ